MEKHCSRCDEKASHKVIRIDLKGNLSICLCDRCYNQMRSGYYSYYWKDVY